jgi:hypothetical protein
VQWLPLFYAEVTEMVGREARRCQEIFGPAAATVLPSLVVEALAPLCTSFRGRLENGLTVQRLGQAHDSTAQFLLAVWVKLRKEGVGDEPLLVQVRAVAEPPRLAVVSHGDRALTLPGPCPAPHPSGGDGGQRSVRRLSRLLLRAGAGESGGSAEGACVRACVRAVRARACTDWKGPVTGRGQSLQGASHCKGPVTGRGQSLEGASHWKGPVTGRGQSLQGVSHWKGSVTARGQSLEGIGRDWKGLEGVQGMKMLSLTAL